MPSGFVSHKYIRPCYVGWVCLISILTAAVYIIHYLAFTYVVEPFVYVLIPLVCAVLSGSISGPYKANDMEIELSLIQVNVYGNIK